jgi:DNA-binding NarL/FixJ family response regulator
MRNEQTDTIYYFPVDHIPTRARELLEDLEDDGIIKTASNCVVRDVKRSNRIGRVKEVLNADDSPRRLKTMELIANGMTYQQVADEMDVSRATVKSSISVVKELLYARNIKHLVAMCIEAGVVRLWDEEKQ